MPSPARPQPPLLWPAPLRPGDRLAIVAPASPIAPEVFAPGVALLESWGLQVVYGPEIFAPRPYAAATDRQVAARLTQAIMAPEVKGIICARGGYGTIRLLEYLDLALLRAHPKYFLGFSDITTLLNLFQQYSGVVTFHGPTVAHLGEVWPEAAAQCQRLLMEPQAGPLSFTHLHVLTPGTATGPLLGGNLAILCSLLGTPYAPELTGAILLFEDYNEPVYRLDRFLQQLRLAGCLEKVRGLLLGGFTGCGSLPSVWEVFATVGEQLAIPVLAGLPIGHQPDNYTVPLGAVVSIDSSQRMVQWQLPLPQKDEGNSVRPRIGD